MFINFIEESGEREGDRDRNINVREKHQSVVSRLHAYQGMETATVSNLQTFGARHDAPTKLLGQGYDILL